ncbi:hypothetical protein FQR65_LT07332 [Abscondita terminalis]|nr:hypothetical protein FQR65_LT07332 [Abscondita terminalis]
MASKIAVFAALLAFANASGVLSPVGYTSVLTPVAKTIVSSEYDPHPEYSYGYSVNDALTGDHKSQVESRNGDVVKGQYSLLDSDGTKRVVDYSSDPINGFNAVVNKIPVVPAPVAHVAAAPVVTAHVASAPVVETARIASAPITTTTAHVAAAPLTAAHVTPSIYSAGYYPYAARLASPYPYGIGYGYPYGRIAYSGALANYAWRILEIVITVLVGLVRFALTMIGKVVLFAALVAVASAVIPISHYHVPEYKYNYAVHDAFTGDSKSQVEARSGDVVKGQYSLLDSDSTKRVVDYFADDVNGFNAVVSKHPVAVPVVAKAVVPTPVATPVAAPALPLAHYGAYPYAGFYGYSGYPYGYPKYF